MLLVVAEEKEEKEEKEEREKKEEKGGASVMIAVGDCRGRKHCGVGVFRCVHVTIHLRRSIRWMTRPARSANLIRILIELL